MFLKTTKFDVAPRIYFNCFFKTSTTGTVVPYKHAHTHLDFEYFQNINEDKTLFFSSSQYQRFFFFLSVSKVFLLPLSNKGFLNFVKKLQFGNFWRNLVVFGKKGQSGDCPGPSWSISTEEKLRCWEEETFGEAISTKKKKNKVTFRSIVQMHVLKFFFQNLQASKFFGTTSSIKICFLNW